MKLLTRRRHAGADALVRPYTVGYNDMNKEWKYAGTCFDSQRFVIAGVNVWDYHWSMTGEKADVKDPQYNQDFSFDVWNINARNEIEFAAGEFSNSVWGFYTRTKEQPNK
jgi:hypothetical protein